jgi:hypothetical protein
MDLVDMYLMANKGLSEALELQKTSFSLFLFLFWGFDHHFGTI